jgi:hypothetical protein
MTDCALKQEDAGVKEYRRSAGLEVAVTAVYPASNRPNVVFEIPSILFVDSAFR